ncbi:agmatine deiminase [Roseovarius sp. EL26]|uniref:agmatine deiminase n=1 Tax=Roseovarius sp. EL26 TaxID=2126672 RepID=UPI001C1F646A|nr:agmatine deiminase [Roseovarius sp. EL26]
MMINRRALLGNTAVALGMAGLPSMGFAKSAMTSSLLKSTPTADGFRMPGEFENHEAIWLVWPEAEEWRNEGKLAEPVIAEMATAISDDIKVRLVVSRREAARVRKMVPDTVDLVEMHGGTNWVRDDGATFLLNDAGERRGVDWKFNSWGYPDDYWDTSKMARRMLKHEGADRYRAPLVIEGGSIHSDGRGTILTTEECLLNPNRNPDLSKAEIENHLKAYLGAQKVVWLPRGVFEDSTSGHVDNMACFAGPSEVILTWTDDQNDPQYERSAEALQVLQSSTDAQGNKFKVHKLHQPGPLYVTDEELNSMPYARIGEIEDRMPASYVNYILTNNRVVYPKLDPDMDQEAERTFVRAFPNREIIGVPGREILLHGGNFHCISQNLPAIAG